MRRWRRPQRAKLAAFVSSQDEYSILVRDVEKDRSAGGGTAWARLSALFPAGERLAHRQVQAQCAGARKARALSAPGLSGRYMNDANWAIVEKLEAFCAARGKTLLELAFAWLLAHDAVPSVIAGATSPEQVEQNAECAGVETHRGREGRGRSDLRVEKCAQAFSL